MSETIKDLWHQQQFRTENASLTVSFRDFVAHCGKAKVVVKPKLLSLRSRVCDYGLIASLLVQFFVSSDKKAQPWVVFNQRALTMLNCTDLACVLHHHHFYAHLHHLKRHLDGHHDEEGECQCVLRAKSFLQRKKSSAGWLHNATAFWIYAIIAF